MTQINRPAHPRMASMRRANPSARGGAAPACSSRAGAAQNASTAIHGPSAGLTVAEKRSGATSYASLRIRQRASMRRAQPSTLSAALPRSPRAPPCAASGTADATGPDHTAFRGQRPSPASSQTPRFVHGDFLQFFSSKDLHISVYWARVEAYDARGRRGQRLPWGPRKKKWERTSL